MKPAAKPPAMTTQTIPATDRHNELLADLDNSLTLLTTSVWEAHERVAEARRALKGFGADAPTQAVSEYLDEMEQLLTQSANPKKTADVDVIVAHYFPGWRASATAGLIVRTSPEAAQPGTEAQPAPMEPYAGKIAA